jgi:hypothetical protein
MAQTLRDWYRYLERQMHVSFPVVPPDSVISPASPPGPPGRPAKLADAPPGADGGRPLPDRGRNGRGPSDGVPRAVLEAEAHAEAVRRRLQTGTDQSALPMELGPRARGPGGCSTPNSRSMRRRRC